MAETPAVVEDVTMGQKVVQASTLLVGGTIGGAAIAYGVASPGMKVQNRLIWSGVGLALGLGLYGFMRYTGYFD